jgi:hypothetical protein
MDVDDHAPCLKRVHEERYIVTKRWEHKIKALEENNRVLKKQNEDEREERFNYIKELEKRNLLLIMEKNNMKKFHQEQMDTKTQIIETLTFKIKKYEHTINTKSDMIEKLLKEKRKLFVYIDSKEGCSICMEEYKTNDVLDQIDGCLHTFHDTCLSTWKKNKNTCPLCRYSLPSS